MKRYFDQKAFTLIELIIVIVILGILIAGSTNLISLGFGSFFTGKDIVNANWQASVALERMARDLRNVATTRDIEIAQTNSIRIKDIFGETITYSVSGGSLLRNSFVLADKINNLSLTYYNANSSLLPQPVTSANVRYVVITLTVVSDKTNFNITTAVNLWNLKT